MTKFLNISTDNTLGGNSPSNEVVPSQKAIKEYVDTHGGGVWGSITGTLSDQTDLANALSGKYDASNPNGYTSNVGTVTSVNNTSPDGNGNVSLTIPDISNLADKDLSNLSSNGKLVVDGQWVVPSSTTIASSVSGDSSYSNEFDLSSFLPNDGQAYDCLFYASGRTGTTSGNTIRIYLTTSLITGGVLVAFGNTRASNSGYAGGACIIPVGTNRKVTMSLDYTGGTATNIELRLAGYRRIGTNS